MRRADAVYAIYLRAASTPPGGEAPEIVTNIVIDEATWDRHLTRLAGGHCDPADPDNAVACGSVTGACGAGQSRSTPRWGSGF